MNTKVLFVDDDVNILNAYQRTFRRYYEIECCEGPEAGLKSLNENGPFAVVVSDLKMPVMNGIEFLSEASDVAPDTVRIMLTGNADLDTSIEAVNEGRIFRFLLKPCPNELFKDSLDAGINQYRLITAERELLDKTLKGSIGVLADVLSLVNPVAFGKATRAKKYIIEIVKKLELQESWLYEVAALFSQLGCVTIPLDVIEKVSKNEPLTAPERNMFENQNVVGAKLLSNIPRLSEVAHIIANQAKNFDGSGHQENAVQGVKIPLGSRMLKVVLDYDKYYSVNESREKSLKRLQENSSRYDPRILETLKSILEDEVEYEIHTLCVRDIKPGMILAQDVKNRDGLLLLTKGQEVTEAMQERLKNYARTVGIMEPIEFHVPSYFWG
ncbi:MAG: HD domain-containing phosphohydrolase [bacterium]